MTDCNSASSKRQLDYVRRFLSTWFRPDDLFEIRAIHPGDTPPRRWFGKLDAIDGMLGWADQISGEGFGVYVGGNPRTRDGGKAEDVALVRGVFADLDGVSLDEARRLRNGVYYEAGLARGQGKPVIHTCRKGELKDAHFDVAHMNFLLWEDPKELQPLVKNRILGSIGEGPLRRTKP